MPQLAYVTDTNSTAAIDPSEYDFLTGLAEVPTAAHANVTVITPDGKSIVGVGRASASDWPSLSQGTWTSATSNDDGTYNLVPLANLAPVDLLNAANPYFSLVATKAMTDTAYATLQQNITAAKSDQAALVQQGKSIGLKPSSGRPVWTAAPVPHWVAVAADAAAQEEGSTTLPEMAFQEDYMRIGCVAFQQAVGPMNLSVQTQTQMDVKPVLRGATALKRLGGTLRKVITFDMIFPGQAAIAMELVPFLKQARRAPFIPIIHSGLIHEHGITAIAVQSIVVNTIPGQPEALSVQVTAYPFTEQRYLIDSDILDTAFNYPLLELWLAADARYNTLNYIPVQDAGLSTPTWNSQVVLATPARAWLDLINENVTPAEQALRNSFLKSDSSGTIQDLGSLGAQALSSDPATSGPALAGLPNDTDATASTSPVLVVKTLSTGISQVPGPFVAFQVTSSYAKYAFADPAKGGPVYLLKQVSRFDPVNGIQGKIVADDERATLRNSSSETTVAQSGQYWALWASGGRNILPETKTPATNSPTTDDQSFQATNALSDASKIQQLDPAKPEFEIPISLENFTIETVSAGLALSLAEIAPTDANTPEYQHLGSSDIVVEFSGVATVDAVQQMYDALYEISRLAVDYRGNQDGSPYGGYCRLDNEIAKIMGLQYAVPQSLSISTIPDFPNLRRVTLSFINFDVSQRKINLPADFSKSTELPAKATAIDSVTTLDDFFTHVTAYAQIDTDLQQMELYQDIQPPKWETLQQWVKDLKEGNVWKEGAAAPEPPYSFLQSWPYTSSWMEDNAGDFLHQLLPYPGDEESPGGFVDPDFYCCARGGVGRMHGSELVENILQSLYDDQHTVAYSGSDGLTFGIIHGDPGIHIVPDGRSTAALGSYVDSAIGTSYTTKLDNGTTPGVLPQVMGVPQTSLGAETMSSKEVPGGVAQETDSTTGFGTMGRQVTALDTTAAFHGAFTSEWNFNNPTSGYTLKANAVQAAAQKLGVPLVLAANILQTESNNPNLIDSSQEYDGADSRGPMQITAVNFPEYFYKAVQQGFLPANATPDHNDLTQNTVTGMLELREYYNHAGRLLQNKSLSSAELQYYSWIYAVACYNAGEGGSRLRTYLKNGGDPHQMEQNIKARSTREQYVPNVFGRGPRVHKSLITVDSFKPLGSNTSAATPSPTPITTPSPTPVATPPPGSSVVSSQDARAAKITDTSGKGWEEILGSAWEYDRAVYDAQNGEDVFYAMRRSENSGRLLRAFPTSCVLLVSGGQWIGFYHLVDTFYGLHSAMDIKVFSTRESPADTAVISFADPYNNLSSATSDVELAKETSTQLIWNFDAILSGIQASVMPNADLIARRKQELKSLLVKPGCRLHVRLGYGGDASQLPIVFNGVVSGVQSNDDILTVTGLGDGVELTSQLSPAAGDGAYYQSVGGAGGGQEIRNIILDILASGSNETAARVTSGIFGATNPYGIEHFGDVRRNVLGVADTSEVGINCYSGWGDQPINITVAAEDGPLGLLAELTDNGTSLANELGTIIAKHFNATSPQFLDGLGMNKMWRCLQGEELVGIRMENATPWTVFDSLRRVCLDYICCVEPFGLRSTLFFGKSWWPFHYAYNSQLQVGTTTTLSQAAQLNQQSAIGNVETFFRRRPFLQAHLSHTGVNLISSSIEPTQEGWCRSVQAIGSYAGMIEAKTTETSLVQYVDTDIFPEFQNMRLVQSGLYSTRNMRLHEGATDLNPGEMLFLQTNALNNYAVGALHDEIRQMYQGDVWITGNGWVRPRHLMHLVDEMKQISGPVEVRSVEHSFSLQSGFMSRWTPDAVAYAHDTSMLATVAHVSSFFARRFMVERALRYAATDAGSAAIRSTVASALRKMGAVDEVVGRGAGAGFRYLEYQATRLTRNLFDRTTLGQFRTKWSRSLSASDGLILSRRDVLNSLETALGGKNNFKARRLRITQRMMYRSDFERILPSAQATFATLQARLKGSALSELERERADKFVEVILTRDAGLLKKPFEILEAGDKVVDKLIDSNFKWAADMIAPNIGSLRTKLGSLSRNEGRIASLRSRIARSPIAAASTRLYAAVIAKADPEAAEALKAVLGRNGTDAAAALARLAAKVTTQEAEVSKLAAKKTSGAKLTPAEDDALASATKDLLKNKRFLALLTKSQQTASLAQKGAEGLRALNIAEKTGGLLAKGGSRATELLANTVIGAATSSFNRYLGSRQALKILPLHRCGKELTAGINGHLGAVVGDPLGPASAWLNFLFNTQQANLPGKVIANTFNLLLGLGDVHYSTDDSSSYQQLVASYGIPTPSTDNPADIATRNRAYLKHLADLNNAGLLPTGVPSVAPSLNSGAPDATAYPGGISYTARNTSIVGQKYSQLVRDLALLIPASDSITQQRNFINNSGIAALQQVDNDLAPQHCQARINRVMASLGGGTYYPQAASAKDLLVDLTTTPYAQYWEQVSGPISIQDAANKYPGGLAVWGSEVGGGNGHVAVLYNRNNKQYMLGNYDGNLSKDVTNTKGKIATVDAVFLPR